MSTPATRPRTAPEQQQPARTLSTSNARGYTPAQLKAFRDADATFGEMDKKRAGKITPGMLLCAMSEKHSDADKLFPTTFLKLDLAGRGAINLDEWRQGYHVRLLAASLVNVDLLF